MCFEIFLIVIQIILDLLLIASPVLAESEKEELTIENRNFRALPCYEEDRIIGAKVFSVKPGSEFAKLEIKKGDIIKAINGKPFDSLKNIGHESSKITSIMIERSANQEGVCNLKPSIPAVLSENISLPKSEVDQSLTDMPHLLTQFRVVPYFRDGNCIGLRFFALKQEGIIKKIGINNGDILETKNCDITEVLKILKALQSESKAEFKIIRDRNKRSINISTK